MDYLYAKSGRTNGLYTGLWQQFRMDCLDQFLNEMTDDLADLARRNWTPAAPAEQP